MDRSSGRAAENFPSTAPSRLSPASLSLASPPSSPLLLPAFLAISRSRSLSLIPILFPLFYPSLLFFPLLYPPSPLLRLSSPPPPESVPEYVPFVCPGRPFSLAFFFTVDKAAALFFDSCNLLAQLASSTPSPDDPPSCTGPHTLSRIHTPLLGPRSFSLDSLRLPVNPDRVFTRGAPFRRDIAAVQGGIVSLR